jgi:hypothetical protein
MKKTFAFLFTLAVACLSSFSAQAQYAKGDITANAGISLGVIGYGAYSYNYYGGGYRGSIPLSASVEYSINDQFALGGYLGYYGRSYKYTWNGDNYRDRWSITSFGVRGSYHATPLLNDLLGASMDEEKWDIYASVLLGYEVWSWSYGYEGSGFNRSNTGSGNLDFGTIVGARYFFSPKFGAFAELGRGSYGLLTLGVTGKF